MSEEDVGKLGNDEIAMLSQRYGQGGEPYIEASKTRQEWAMLKTLVRSQHYPTESLPVLWNIINTHHRDVFSNLLILASMAVVFPVHIAGRGRIEGSIKNYVKQINILFFKC